MKYVICVLLFVMVACGSENGVLSPTIACAETYKLSSPAEQITRLECDGVYRVILTQMIPDLQVGNEIKAYYEMFARNDTGVNINYVCGISLTTAPNRAYDGYQMARPNGFNITPDLHKFPRFKFGYLKVTQAMVDAGAMFVNGWCRAMGTKATKGDYLKITETYSSGVVEVTRQQ